MSTATGRGGQVSMSVAGTVLGIVIGLAGGYYIRYFQETPQTGSAASSRGMSSGGMSGGMMGGGGMGGGMGGSQPPPGATLARTVRNLDTLVKLQGLGLTTAQAQSLAPILKSLQSGDKLSDKDAQNKADAIDKVLTDAQKQGLQDMQPRGGRGGGPGGPGGGMSPQQMASAGHLRSGGPVAMAGGGMGGGQPDPERPFASGRSKDALDDLIGRTQGTK